MKTALIALTLAAVAFTIAAPIHAASLSPAMTAWQMLDGVVEKRRHQCNTPAQIASNPICTKP